MERRKCHVNLLKLLFFCTISFLTVVNGDILYTKDDPIVLLDKNNFDNIIHNQPNVWFVEFYNSWCGACIRFAPTWKALGGQVEEWAPVIQIAAIDCSMENNVQICNQHIGSEGYPTIKFLSPFYRAGLAGEIYSGGRNISDLRRGMVDYVQKVSHRFKTSVVALSFTPLQALEDIWNDVTETIKHTVVIFEDSTSYIGRETILDVIKWKSILIRRVLKSEVNRYGVTVFPSMFLIDKGGTFKQLASGPLQPQYRDVLCDMIGVDRDDDKAYEGAGDHEDEADRGVKHMHESLTVIHMQDLESTLTYSLRQEVTSCGNISGDTLQALTHYVYILAKYFPGQKPIIEFLWTLYRWIKTQTHHITGTAWLSNLERLQTRAASLPSTVRWQCCEGSSARYRGYPCGMWAVFHTLTVQAARIGDKYADFHPHEVLSAMHGYITRFFGCKECGLNFQKEISSLSNKTVSTADAAILYLWRVHNSVNKRLHGDVTEDPEFPKLQFPTNHMCPTCHMTSGEIPGNSEDQWWNENQVLKFLKEVYSLDRIIQDTQVNISNSQESQLGGNSIPTLPPGGKFLNIKDPQVRHDMERFKHEKLERDSKKNLKYVEREKYLDRDSQREAARLKLDALKHMAMLDVSVNRTGHSGWGFSGLDIAVCVLLYLTCSVIILATFYHFLVRKRFAQVISLKWWFKA